MAKAPKLRMMPVGVDDWQSSTMRAKCKDYQRSWFWELIFHMWSNQRKPGYLPLDGQLWTLAGAHSKAFFDRESAVVMAAYKVVELDGMKWIYHEGLLQRMKKSVTRYNAKKPEGGGIEATTNVYVVDSDFGVGVGSKTSNKTEIPTWVPEKAWLAFVEMRKAMKKPLTEFAKELAIKRLKDICDSCGATPEAVIYEAVMRNWLKFYPPDGNAITKVQPGCGDYSQRECAECRKVFRATGEELFCSAECEAVNEELRERLARR